MTEDIYSPDLYDILKLMPSVQAQQEWVLMGRRQELDAEPFKQNFLHRPLRIMGTFIGLTPRSMPGRHITINGRKYYATTEQASLVFFKPGDIVYSEIEPTSLYALYFMDTASTYLQIDLSRMLPVIFHVQTEPVFFLSEDEAEDLLGHYERAFAYVARRDEWGMQIFQRLLGVYCLRVVEILESRIPKESLGYDERSRQETWLLMEFLRLVSAAPSRQKTVAHYAQLLHTSYKHFSAIIKRNSRRSAIEWIDFHILHQIKSLLSYSDLSIQEISYRLDFSSPSHLSKFFRQHTGQTPSEYQAQARSRRS